MPEPCSSHYRPDHRSDRITAGHGLNIRYRICLRRHNNTNGRKHSLHNLLGRKNRPDVFGYHPGALALLFFAALLVFSPKSSDEMRRLGLR